MKITPSQVQQAIWKAKPSEYYADCLKIEHKGCSNPDCECKKNIARLAPFRLNSHQKKVQETIDNFRKNKRPVRLKILKPRQTGISTEVEAIIFHGVRFWGGGAMAVSMDFDSSEHIYRISQRFHNHLPDREADILVAENSNRKELKFADPHGGRILVETAGKSSAGHSFTIRHLHLSEVSRWPEGCDDAIVGLLNAVPDEPDTEVIVESVANGMQGWFYTFWHEKNDYIPVFLPWFEHIEYQKPLPLPVHLYEANLQDEERRLIAKHNLTLEQIEFRRWAILNKCKKDPEKFKEQYPATAEEAFITSGQAFFNLKTIDTHPVQEGTRGELRIIETISGQEETRFFPKENGPLTIFQKPQKGKDYVLGADVAEGIEIEGAPADDKHDYSCADILDRDTGDQVAHFHARVTPDEFGRLLDILGRYYNHVFMGIENNGGYGQHTLTTLINETEYPSHLLYRDLSTPNKLGWCTTRANRKSLCSALDMAQRDNEILIHCAETVMEMRAFVTKPDGRVEAGSGNKDDRVFSLAIANRMLELAPPKQFGKSTGEPRSNVIRYGPSIIRRIGHPATENQSTRSQRRA